jgi:hypothetical protein
MRLDHESECDRDTKMAGTKPGHFKNRFDGSWSYAVTWSGNTASILVFSVAALNGLTI